jgi:septum formation protein
MTRKLILASTSPRRKNILKFLGIPHKAVPPKGVVEKRRNGESPRRLVGRLALEKALSIHRLRPDQWVLGADTLVVQKGLVYGKPRDLREASRVLSRLNGKRHQVLTGIALIRPGGKIWKGVDQSTVHFQLIGRRELENYVKTSLPYDKAGGYDIRGWGRRWVSKLEGDYFNVMGLPANLLLKALAATGFFE